RILSTDRQSDWGVQSPELIRCYALLHQLAGKLARFGLAPDQPQVRVWQIQIAFYEQLIGGMASRHDHDKSLGIGFRHILGKRAVSEDASVGSRVFLSHCIFFAIIDHNTSKQFARRSDARKGLPYMTAAKDQQLRIGPVRFKPNANKSAAVHAEIRFGEFVVARFGTRS